MPEEARSLERITVRDLTQFARIAAADRQAFFAKQPKCAKLVERVVCVALCQGAALHFIDGRNGVKDFDVWTFYAGLSGLTFPPRRIVSRDFGFAEFRRSPGWPHFKGRRVDLLGRSISARKTSDPAAFLRRYLPDERPSPRAFWREGPWCCWSLRIDAVK